MASPAKAPVGYTNGTSFVWNTKGEVIAAAAILPFLGIVLVGLRFYNRIRQKAGIGADDWLIVPATVSLHPLCVLRYIVLLGRISLMSTGHCHWDGRDAARWYVAADVTSLCPQC